MDTSVSAEEIAAIMDSLRMDSSDAARYRDLVAGMLGAISLVDELPQEQAPVVERAWHVPDAADNPLGAWYVRTEIAGNGGGKLAGKRVAVKDNVLLAGVPLMNGTTILEGYTPNVDAEIVTRMLDAGATITGKTVCEAYCFSGGSHTSATGPVHNPHAFEHTAGGSSSGSGVVVATGDADMAIGCDQGGSIRMPASFCGIVGMKPTFALVPYTGVLGMNANIDHTGPMTADVADNALLLEVLAGPDGMDSRQVDVRLAPYTEALGKDLAGVRLAVVREGFGADAAVDAKVRAAAQRIGTLGAEVREVSIPMHTLAGAITFGGLQAIFTSMFHLDGCVLERPDLVPADYVAYQHRWRDRANELPANVKVGMLTAELLRRRDGFVQLARARQRLPALRAAYDAVLSEADALIMPTTPTTAPRLPPAGAPPDVVTAAAFGPLANTSPFNSTHHPALSVPCGMADGLPVGMMLVGAHFAEADLYRIGHAFEQHEDWRQL